MALCRILKFRPRNAEIDIAIIMTVLDILKKAANNWRRYHISNTLCDVTAITLKGNSDDFAAL